jgi:hypothetical protein
MRLTCKKNKQANNHPSVVHNPKTPNSARCRAVNERAKYNPLRTSVVGRMQMIALGREAAIHE